MNSHFAKIVLASLVIGSFFLFFFKETTTENFLDQKQGQVKDLGEGSIQVSRQSKLHDEEIAKCVVKPDQTIVIKEKEFDSNRLIRSKIWEVKESFKENPQELLRQTSAARDTYTAEIYSLALFELAKSCFKFSLSDASHLKQANTKSDQFEMLGCNSLPQEFIRYPLAILEKLANTDGSLLKKQFFIEALEIAPLYKKRV